MKVILIQLLLVSAVLSCPGPEPVVETNRGLIRGLQATDGDYAMFLGIPYARVNESNPFGPSHPYPDFNGVFDAIDDSTICPQVSEFTNMFEGSLDCLHLNIYVPNKESADNRLPVLVWIYGGRFQIGNAVRDIYGPKYLMRHDVILVTVNYRLGPYGFMCLDTAEVPGNQGLKDQLGALRWINENIGAFGGDANKVTLFGESAGGVSVDFHRLYTQEKLFDKVIFQSGSALCPWGVVQADREAPVRIAQRLGLNTEDAEVALAFLAKVEPRLIIITALGLSMSFFPCVEKELEGVESYMSTHPVQKVATQTSDIPILAGYNSHETLAWYAHRPAETYKFLDVFNENLEKGFDLDDDEMEKLMRQFYIGDEDPNIEVKDGLMNFESDVKFGYPVYRSVQKYLADAGTAYHYIFSYSGGRNFVKFTNNITDDGAAHADELGYLFDIAVFTEDPTKEDQLVIDRMTTLWTNFVKYGDPTPDTSHLLPTKWTPATKDSLNYIDIDSHLTLKRRPFNDRMAFWDLFYKKYYNYVLGFDGDN